MSVPEPENLFPLPLTPFEKSMLIDQADGFPMAFLLQFRVQGQVNQDVMSRALAEALRRHPLLTCHIRHRWTGTDWVWSGQVPEVNWDPGDWQSARPWDQHFDLRTEIGLRIWGEQTDIDAHVTFQFHHACCDGIGASRFLEDYAITYTRLCDAATFDEDDLPVPSPVNQQLLRTRHASEGRRVAFLPKSLRRRWAIIKHCTLHFLRERKLVLLPKSHSVKDSERRDSGLISLQLSRAETRAIRDVAKNHNATINDLLLRDLMLTLDAWNRSAGYRPRRTWFSQPRISILVPSSLRGPADHQLPACNVVGYLFLGRMMERFARPVDLLHSLRDEMRLAHEIQEGWFYLQVLNVLHRIPGALWLSGKILARTCMCTAVLSHLGNVMNAIGSRLPQEKGRIRMGNVLVEEIRCIPPLRPHTNAAFATMTVNGCLQINIRCNAQNFTSADTQQLLNMFADRLRASAGTGRSLRESKLVKPSATSSVAVPEQASK